MCGECAQLKVTYTRVRVSQVVVSSVRKREKIRGKLFFLSLIPGIPQKQQEKQIFYFHFQDSHTRREIERKRDGILGERGCP